MRYSTDTRTIRPGETFVAIEGERFDGHAFIDQALTKGASQLVVEKSISVPAHVPVIQVESSEQFLADEAHNKLLRIGPDVVAITGSVGKTSTKNAITTVLKEQFPVLSTSGNLNTVLGVSLTILNGDFDASTKVVLEMGACRRGDIAELCRYFPPNVSVVTNVHGVHLETFGSIEGVVQGKSEIVQALKKDGIACLNSDDERVSTMVDGNPGRTLWYGTSETAEISPSLIYEPLPILGNHAIYLALAAFAVGHALEMPHDVIRKGLSSLRPEKGRLSKLMGISRSVLIDDTYNASPVATLNAIALLESQNADRRIAYLGDMLELGPDSQTHHKEIIRRALEVADEVVLVGPHMKSAMKLVPHQSGLTSFDSALQAVDALPEFTSGDVILVKGSQGVRMEHISRALLHPDVNPEEALCRQTQSWREIRS